MKNRNIYAALLALASLTACEDYTEHNFGSRDELYQPTQLSNLQVTLTDANYEDIAKNEDNKALALAADTDSTTYRDLLSVGEKKYFRGNISPDAYLPAMLRQLVGNSQYYAMTSGSSITITYMAASDSTVNGTAFTPAASFQAGKYLMAPLGEEQVLGNSGPDVDHGYLNITGSTTCPQTITRLTPETISDDEAAQRYLYDFLSDGDYFVLRNALGMYLYLDGTHASFQYTDDIDNDVDEREYAQWKVTACEDGTYDIINVGTEQQILYGTSYSSAGCYTDRKGTEGYLPIQLYAISEVSTVVDSTPIQDEIIFTLDEDGWAAKGDYLNQTLLGFSSNDVNVIYENYGWSIEHVGSIGNLTYVWNMARSYGLKASAYVSGNRYTTDSWAISPSMNLKKAKKPIFAFEHTQRFALEPVTDWLKIYVSTDYSGRGGQPTATWTEVTYDAKGEWPDGATWDFVPMQLDLSAFAGQTNVVVAFRYLSSDHGGTNDAGVAPTWEVKNVRCAEEEDILKEE